MHGAELRIVQVWLIDAVVVSCMLAMHTQHSMAVASIPSPTPKCRTFFSQSIPPYVKVVESTLFVDLNSKPCRCDQVPVPSLFLRRDVLQRALQRSLFTASVQWKQVGTYSSRLSFEGGQQQQHGVVRYQAIGISAQ